MQFRRRTLGFVCLAAILTTASIASAQGPQADASLPLFTVIAAAVAADTDGAVYTRPRARQLRKDLAGTDIPSLDEIRRFHALNKADYTRLFSFALVIEGPPDFGFRYREVDLPLDAQNLVGLNAMLSAFYNEAHIDDLWGKYRPQY